MNNMTPDLFHEMRYAMVVSQLRPDGVNDPRVIEAMGIVPREDYVPDDRRSTAYADRLIPMGDGRGINPPMVTGRLLSEARIVAGEHVLIVGSATGYTAAIVAMLTDSVTVAEAGETLKGSYDVIMIDGAVEHVPDLLIERLTTNGRLITGVVVSGVTSLAIGRRGGTGFGLVSFMDAEMVVLPEFALPSAFVF
jgi:protein-L-isoaspartate(D-aspartate) O-methyltransferase